MRLFNAETQKQLDEIKELYLKSFPEEELKPFEMLIDNSKCGKGELLYIEKDNEFAGHVLMATDKDLALLDYFAVAENKRGCGTGSEVMAMLQKRYADKKFFLEVETLSVPCDNLEQRQRRLNFYHRCGMKEAGFLVEVRGVAMDVLTHTADISFDDYSNLYRNLFGEEIFKQVKLLKTY